MGSGVSSLSQEEQVALYQKMKAEYETAGGEEGVSDEEIFNRIKAVYETSTTAEESGEGGGEEGGETSQEGGEEAPQEGGEEAPQEGGEEAPQEEGGEQPSGG